MDALFGNDVLWLAQAGMLMLMLGLALALVVGLLLMVRPPLLFAVNARLSTWVDTQSGFASLEQPVVLERFFYRHHRIVGSFIALGAAVVLWRWAVDYDRRAFLATLGRWWIANRLDWIVAALEWALVALHALILLLGLIVLVRPSLLKNVEGVANQWRRSGPPAEALNAVVIDIDGRVQANPQIYGFVLSLGATWSLSALLPIAVRLLER